MKRPSTYPCDTKINRDKRPYKSVNCNLWTTNLQVPSRLTNPKSCKLVIKTFCRHNSINRKIKRWDAKANMRVVNINHGILTYLTFSVTLTITCEFSYSKIRVIAWIVEIDQLIYWTNPNSSDKWILLLLTTDSHHEQRKITLITLTFWRGELIIISILHFPSRGIALKRID